MPTAPTILISVNGGPERSGSLRVNGGDWERFSWEGRIDAEHYPGERHPIVITTDENTYTGEALFVECEHTEGQVVSRFQGASELLRTPRLEGGERRG
ncbi:hypothetical protein Ait01nite_032000 [Actinoplanes italicus]|uniref:Uncharacterized protein n=1 Tax=Actinoplanes italicus TaxID=113567 RepID=A0A2T0KJG4_9ACTN|nr:hypothetical protein [Actinoplanes italicus]PRX23654.1 hypothetical protein CLV67_103403 [Actinoplanes italicus]GIE30155.1 hypothetical protein Ait01nite_032000 [Actinoplanes italicus]